MEVKELMFQILLLLLQLSWLAVVAVEGGLARPNCAQQCGNNVTIPYPFGIGRRDCFLDEWYEVVCQNDVPLLKKLDLEIFNISMPNNGFAGFLNVSFPITYSTGNCSGIKSGVNGTTTSELAGSKFFFSQSQNVLTAVGCDMLTFLDNNNSAIVGCKTSCRQDQPQLLGGRTFKECSGTDGCCQNTIPSNLQVFNLKSQNTDGAPCNHAYAFLVDQFWFVPNVTELSLRQHVPVILDWAIANDTGLAIYRNDPKYNKDYSYGCSTYSDRGYWYCYCLNGYGGNPYLHECRDIDECQNKTLNTCHPGYCVNTKGSYRCADPRRTLKLVLIAIAGGIGALLLLVFGRWAYKVVKRRKKMQLKKKFFKRNGGLLLQQQLASPEGNIERSKLFSSKELDKATDRFSENRIIGQGGQGTVYKGMLTDGRIVAIKKPKVLDVDEGNVEQFINEVFILSQINHRFIVKLIGCCLETEYPLLVYEFIPNGTLYDYLHDRNEELPISWDIRLQIASEVAGALSYLHSAASVPIYHRDVKTTNILLDEKYRAKVADFGTSRSISLDQTHVTTLVQGTFGYLDPEYFQSSKFTDKSDVYSFGVVLVELLTRLKPSSSVKVTEGMGLASYFMIAMEENRLSDILDAQVLKSGNKDEIMAVADLARRCLNLSGRQRPTMKEIAVELYRIRKLQDPSGTEEVEETSKLDKAEEIEAHDISLRSTRSKSEADVISMTDIYPLIQSTTW